MTATVTSSNGTPNGVVTFYTGSTNLGTATLNGNGVATFTTTGLSSGQNTVTAVYGGASGFASSSSNVITETVMANFSLTSSPSSQSVYAGAKASFTLTVTPGNGFTLPVTLSCSGLPVGTTCVFSPSVLTSGSSLLQIQTASPNARNVTASSMLSAGNRLAALFGFCMMMISWRFRRNFSRSWKMLLVLLMLSTVGMVTGCGSNPTLSGGTAVGNYTITVTGTAATGSQMDSMSTNITLQVNSLY